MKEFNTTAVCIPEKHYMVDISDKVYEIRKLVDAGKYFTINRARQYGKTTTLNQLKKSLSDEYTVLALDFQSIDKDVFENGSTFSQAFARLILDMHEFDNFYLDDETVSSIKKLCDSDVSTVKMDELFRTLKRWIKRSDRPVVLIIDEVDSASNNQVFLDFLAQLREGYIRREVDNAPAFHSVILAGVTDIRHLQSKIRDEDQHKVNSPWNIAADFNVDMSLSEAGIKGMLDDYEGDHHTGMDTAYMAKAIHDYTSGYPFLISRLCQLIDKDVSVELRSLTKAWTRYGLDEAVKMILSEKNTLFQSITGKLLNYPDLKDSVRMILMEGARISYNALQDSVDQLHMYGLIRNENNSIRISNRIFETLLYNLFLSDEELKNNDIYKEGERAKNMFVTDGKLDMRLIMERFIATYTEVCGPLTDKFKEKDGRELFLLYLKPIINGTGNYYVEAETRNQTRTDVIVDYLGQQYIIELKIWRGERYNAEGEKQISEYLNYYGLTVGYMLSFNFNKKKEQGVKRAQIGDKILFEGVV